MEAASECIWQVGAIYTSVSIVNLKPWGGGGVPAVTKKLVLKRMAMPVICDDLYNCPWHKVQV